MKLHVLHDTDELSTDDICCMMQGEDTWRGPVWPNDQLEFAKDHARHYASKDRLEVISYRAEEVKTDRGCQMVAKELQPPYIPPVYLLTLKIKTTNKGFSIRITKIRTFHHPTKGPK